MENLRPLGRIVATSKGFNTARVDGRSTPVQGLGGTNMSEDPLAPARGCLYGIALSAVLFFLVVWLLTKVI